jgi:hypothetical protein
VIVEIEMMQQKRRKEMRRRRSCLDLEMNSGEVE